MEQQLDDQLQAAVVETRKLVNRGMGVPENEKTEGVSAWFEEIWAQVATAPRCSCLKKVPIQPSYMWLSVAKHWFCRPCFAKFLHKWQAAGAALDSVEEHTCDRCRRYVSGELLPTVVRQDFWVITVAVCKRCEQDAIKQGARILGD